jgi:two-component system chemotaxis response regulator CheY
MKLMSVYDSVIIKKIIGGAADVLGYELLESSDGGEAIILLKENFKNVRLILLGWNISGMSSIEFLKIVKANEHFKHIPVIMVTTEDDKAIVSEAIDAGASYFLKKPLTVEKLINRILERV